MSEESVMSSRLRDLTEFTEAEGRDDTHHFFHPLPTNELTTVPMNQPQAPFSRCADP